MLFNATHVLTAESSAPDCTPTTMVINDTMGVSVDAPQPTRGLDLSHGDSVGFRLMFRRGMYDLYLRNALILSYALAVDGGEHYAPTQELRLVGSWASSARGVRSWRMSLPGDVP